MRKITSFTATSAILLHLLSPSLVLSASTSENIQLLQNVAVSKEAKEQLSYLLSTNELPQKRPQFCPLNNTASYAKTVDSLKSIMTVFKDDCFDGNANLVNQILDNSKVLEEELNKISKDQGKTPTTTTSDSSNVEISGIKVSQVLDGFDTLFNKNKCSSLDTTPFLERTADVIQTFSQFGMYSPAGITYAYGGLATASILRFINNLFSKRFKFENDADIQTFIKLNCAYYDVRNQIKDLQVFELDTARHHKDKLIVTDLLKEITESTKSIVSAKNELNKEVKKSKIKYVTSIEKDLKKKIESLYEKVKNPVINKEGRSARYQQAEILGELSFDIDKLLILVDDYTRESSGSERFLNILFKLQLEKLLTPEVLMKLSAKEFNDSFLIDISSSFKRVLSSINSKREKAAKNFVELRATTVNGEDLLFKDIISLLSGKDLEKRVKNIVNVLSKATTINDRIDAIIGSKEYSRDDSNDAGTREIIKSLDVVRNHVYGKYGKQFLEKTRTMSRNQNNNFSKTYKEFSERYLDQDSIRPSDQLSEDNLLNACIDAQTIREIWVYSQKLSELGYDFISTNNDVFGDPGSQKDRKKIKSHADSVILARRIISAKNYRKKIENYQQLGKTSISLDGKTYDLVQAIEQIKRINFYGKSYSVDQATELLESLYGPKLLEQRRLGYVMLDITNNRSKALKLQKLYKQYGCDTASTLNK